MALYPEAQKAAHEEIDSVIGRSRLPSYEDRVNLPYVNALIKEVMRLNPAVPMGIPHVSVKDFECGGYRIPRGGMVMANIWSISHDPSTFKPSRFLGPTPEPDPSSYIFGFGRRVCPGRALAESTLYLAISQTFAAFNICRAVRDGKEVEIDPWLKAGETSHPVSFEVESRVRDERYKDLIVGVEDEYPFENADAGVMREIFDSFTVSYNPIR